MPGIKEEYSRRKRKSARICSNKQDQNLAQDTDDLNRKGTSLTKQKVKIENCNINKIKVKEENVNSILPVVPDVVVSSTSSDTSLIKPETDSVNTNRIKLKEEMMEESGKSKNNNDTFIRPTPGECQYATDSLSSLHPEVVSKNDDRRKTLLESCGMRDCVTDAIVSTMLSQNTTDANSKAAFKSLKKTFPNWEYVANCTDISKIEKCIRVAGLAKTRAERIQTMLQTVQTERGTASLNYIKEIANDDEVKKELSRFKGLGPKTISCVLLFALGRPEFPVDTHVVRITKAMGWIKQSDTRESAYDHLNKVVPNHLKLDLHCLLVQHGKCCHRCASRNRPQFPPKDGTKLHCPLRKAPTILHSDIVVCKNEK
jgi:endonuclease-3